MLILSIRKRIGVIVAAVVGTAAMLGCGAMFAFVFSPGQALEARRIEKMPLMDAEALVAAPIGEAVLLTGRLEDSPRLDGNFVAYTLDEWVVTPANLATPDDKPDGSWKRVERVVPALNLNVGGQAVSTLSASDATLSGPLHEELAYSNAYRGAEDTGGEWLPAGSLRYRGLFNGDLVTVLGKKASTGDVIPEEIYAGDRVAFAESKRRAARGLFTAGLCLMGLAPVVLVGGVLSALFGRRR